MSTSQRRCIPVVQPEADRGIRQHYALDRADWLWHPELGVDEIAAVKFSLRFTLDQPLSTQLHLSADQRFEWWIDGEPQGMGPDRSDLDHWSIHSYDIQLDAGDHEITAHVWWLGHLMPTAQTTIRGAFVFAAETPSLTSTFNTGQAPWQVQRICNWSYDTKEMHAYHVIGPQQTIDGRKPTLDAPTDPVVVQHAVNSNSHGVMVPGWRLYPSPLPNMMSVPRSAQRVRAAGVEQALASPDTIAQEHTAPEATKAWQPLLNATGPLQVAPGQSVWAILDLDDYACGFPQAQLAGEGQLRMEWAESLFIADEDGRCVVKENRDEVIGKTFFGYGDTFIAGEHQKHFTGHWWRSGRYLRITAEAGSEPLLIEQLRFIETRYPLQDAYEWSSDDAELDTVMPVALRGLQMCMHETYVDCPYYEQMMYGGDTRLQMLVNHVVSSDDRLVKRGIELFDWSRYKTGFVAERYPSTPIQLSLTFAMIWVKMVHDHALYHDDPAWVKQRMLGIRSMLDRLLTLLNEQGLFEAMPGWSFVDWVRGGAWEDGYPPSAKTHGVSSVINLHLMLALRAATDLETWHGEAVLAQRYQQLADDLADRIFKKFWREDDGLLADDEAGHLSEHAQCLALLTDTLPASKRDACFESLATRDDLQPTTVYFSHYLLETFHQFGRGDLILDRLAFWKGMVARGLRTPAEKPEPSRSDCHAWGSHPLFHAHASLAGVRPAAPGYSSFSVTPTPGPLRSVISTTPHPQGELRIKIEPTTDQRASIHVTAPPQTPGTLSFAGQQWPILAGQSIDIVADYPQ